MFSILHLIAVVLAVLSPFAVVAMTWRDEIRIEVNEMSVAIGLRRLLTVVLPVWAPAFFLSICWLLHRYGPHDPIPSLHNQSLYLIFSMPAAWAISLVMMGESGLFSGLLLLPLLYGVGIVAMGGFGWTACGSLHMC